MRNIIGIDNGVTGWIGVYKADTELYYTFKTPTRKQNDMNLLDTKKLVDILRTEYNIEGGESTFFLLEKPMAHPQRYKATKAAHIFYGMLYTTLVLKFDLTYYKEISAVEWQRKLFGCTGKNAKAQAVLKAKELYCETKDADGLMLAYYGVTQLSHITG